MFLGLRTFPETKLVGQSKQISIVQMALTGDLWRGFIPRKNEITNVISGNLFSLSVYPPSYNFKNFDFNAPFFKWAAAAVTGFENTPAGMETLTIPEGLYAVFLHKGLPQDGEKTFRYIFSEWLPGSGYEIDSRPHFEILGPKYKNNDPDSEEEIFIPIV